MSRRPKLQKNKRQVSKEEGPEAKVAITSKDP